VFVEVGDGINFTVSKRRAWTVFVLLWKREESVEDRVLGLLWMR